MVASYADVVRVEIVVADGMYYIHIPTKKPGDVQKYNPRPGELVAVCINPAVNKLVGVPLRPHAEPLFARHFARMLSRFSNLPWVVAVKGTDIEQLVEMRFAAMCIQAHIEWSCVLKSTPNLLTEPISRGFLELKHRDPGTTFIVRFPAALPPAPISQPHPPTAIARSQDTHAESHQDEERIPESYSAWANKLFRFDSSPSLISSIMSADDVELLQTPRSTCSDATMPPLAGYCSPRVDQPEESLPPTPPGAAVRTTFDRMLSPTTAWWNKLRS